MHANNYSSLVRLSIVTELSGVQEGCSISQQSVVPVVAQQSPAASITQPTTGKY